MAIFKLQARRILSGAGPSVNPEDFMDHVDYKIDGQMDIVNTYKMLKNTLVKS